MNGSQLRIHIRMILANVAVMTISCLGADDMKAVKT